MHGISLTVDRYACASPESDDTNADATNGGPTGVELPEERNRSQGHVLCTLARVRDGPRVVDVVKYPTDEETHVSVLNVECSVYPYDAVREAKQVERVKRAMQALERTTP
jgi:hypothetical protein